MPDQYYHTPLQHPRQIRVLHLEPVEDSAAPIRCRLATISLDDHQEWDGDYTALSYSWDSQMPSCEIGCNGDNLLITANCEAALRELRDPSETTKLWIDSICIDQSRDAVEERNIQVALMGEIYKCAKRVVVWLGKSDIRIRRALDVVVEIASMAEDSSMGSRPGKQSRCYEKAQEISNKVKHDSEDPLGALFNRSWFHRMWTVQEVTLSWIDRVALRCGNIQVPWTQLVIAGDALQAAKYKWGRWKEALSLQQQLASYVLHRRYPGAKALLDDNPGYLHNNPLVFQILVNARRKTSTDPRDKIFALCGLFKELEIPFPAPNYSRPVEDVYRVAVISCINYDKNLYILHHIPSDQRSSGLPSWVPDLAENGWDESDPRYGVIQDSFAASGRSNAKWSFSEDGTGLILVGKIVDQITFRADPMPSLDSVANEIKYIVGSASESGESLRYRDPDSEIVADYLRLTHKGYSVLKTWVEISQWSEYPTGETTKEALRRTLIYDHPKYNEIAAKDDSFDRWYNIMNLGELDLTARAVERVGARRSIPSQPWAREIYLRQMMKRFTQEQLVAAALGAGLGGTGFGFHSHVMAVSQKKCFFFTENCYFGTAADPLPVPIEPGDKIAIIRGLGMPLALRPVEGGYKLLTHVHVHGFMYGEAWPQNEDSLEEIILL